MSKEDDSLPQRFPILMVGLLVTVDGGAHKADAANPKIACTT